MIDVLLPEETIFCPRCKCELFNIYKPSENFRFRRDTHCQFIVCQNGKAVFECTSCGSLCITDKYE